MGKYRKFTAEYRTEAVRLVLETSRPIADATFICPVDAAISQLLTAEAELLEGISAADQERLSALLRKLSLDFD